MALLGDYLLRILWCLDVLVMVILRGHLGETLSSCSYRMHRDKRFWGFLMPMINTLIFWEPQHCYNSYLADRTRVYPT